MKSRYKQDNQKQTQKQMTWKFQYWKFHYMPICSWLTAYGLLHRVRQCIFWYPGGPNNTVAQSSLNISDFSVIQINTTPSLQWYPITVALWLSLSRIHTGTLKHTYTSMHKHPPFLSNAQWLYSRFLPWQWKRGQGEQDVLLSHIGPNSKVQSGSHPGLPRLLRMCI